MPDKQHRWSEAIMDQAERCVAPIWASLGPAAPPASVDHNGTATFIDTGQRKILVTAHHVLAKFREIRADHPGAGLAINLGNGVTPFLEEFEVIDEDRELDVAVIAFSSLTVWSGHQKLYFPIRAWPIPLPRRGDAVTIVGFPGSERRASDRFGVFSPVGIGMIVSNDPSRHVILADETGTLRTVQGDTKRDGGIEPGGMSGSAGFFFRDGWFHVAGFVYEGRPGILFLAPGARLSRDGSLIGAL